VRWIVGGIGRGRTRARGGEFAARGVPDVREIKQSPLRASKVRKFGRRQLDQYALFLRDGDLMLGAEGAIWIANSSSGRH